MFKSIKQKNKRKNRILIYTEQTPNDSVLKFVTNKKLLEGACDFSDREYAKKWSPFVSFLYDMDNVQSVFINNNYVSIEKSADIEWHDIMYDFKKEIKNYLEEEKQLVVEGFEEMLETERKKRAESESDNDVILKIREIIDEHIRPGIQMDGGNIEFVSYQDGVVTVALLGACRGCSAAGITLSGGVERILKSMLPQVKEVVLDEDY